MLTGMMACTGPSTGEEKVIPFPEALEGAGVVQSRITDIQTQAIVLGNGDMNALLWEDAGVLRMRVSKNDIWDARINTSKDPELFQVDIRNRTWGGGVRYVPSFWDQPYPQPHCAAVISIDTPGKLTSLDKENDSSYWNAQLDLRRAAVMLEGKQNEQIVVRTLAQQNTFLILGPGMVFLDYR